MSLSWCFNLSLSRPSPERRPRSDYDERGRAYDDDPRRTYRNEPARDDTRRDYDDAPQRGYPPVRRSDPREQPYYDEREPRFRDEQLRSYRDNLQPRRHYDKSPPRRSPPRYQGGRSRSRDRYSSPPRRREPDRGDRRPYQDDLRRENEQRRPFEERRAYDDSRRDARRGDRPAPARDEPRPLARPGGGRGACFASPADIERNKRITKAGSAGEIHAIVANESLNMVNAATAVSRLARLGSVGGGDAPWERLRDTVSWRASRLKPRETSNIILFEFRTRRLAAGVADGVHGGSVSAES